MWEWLKEHAESFIVPAIKPWAERFKKEQEDSNLQKYNDRFDSFKLVSRLDEALKGRGNDPIIAAEVEKKLRKKALSEITIKKEV